MVFSSLTFTFLFLPVVLLLYYPVKNNTYRNDLLLIASILFYSFGEPFFVYIMLASVVINYSAALLIDRYRGKSLSRICFVVDIMLNIGILWIFKYLDFSIEITNSLFNAELPMVGVTLPIGISFYTFQALSYVIDVYKGTVKVQKNPLYVALYIAFFPQLIAGPIVRYSSIEEQIHERKCSLELFSDGARRFMQGFCKKVILANNLAMVAQETFALDMTQANPLYLWIGSICYSLQIYYDFSGYSDMAIGLGKMFGFRFEENFDHPYIARSVTDFWRRWHISLSRWFRDYVYIPLGGNRVKKYRLILNLFIVWLLTGIWHGANYTFVVWGLGYFILLLIEKELVKPEKHENKFFEFIWRLVTLLCVNFGWVMFNSADINKGLQYWKAMIGGFGGKAAIDGNIIFCIREYGFFMICGVLFAMPLMKLIKIKTKHPATASVITAIEAVGCALCFLWAVSFLVLGAHNPFIYFNF
ncbi:MAG: MBOAT family protein [Lachnospiraceae bacterium]|nr:MBOAT family protein [Lachnospiraceae bacterium]